MSYKAELQANNTELQSNNVDLQGVLDAILALPESGGGSSAPKLIEFTLVHGATIAPTTEICQAEDGMNWGAWAYSEYNPESLKFSTDTGLCVSQTNVVIYFATATPSVKLNDVSVSAFDEIQGGAIYYATYEVPDTQ